MAVEKTLNKYDEWVRIDSQVQLLANNPVIVARMEPPKKMGMLVRAYPYLFLELRDTSGNKLPGNAKILLAGIDQAHDLPMQLSASHYLKPWNDISFAEQKNAKYRDNFVIDLRENVFVEEKEQLLLVVISPVTVTLDWSQSDFELKVEEMTMEEAAAYAGSEFFV